MSQRTRNKVQAAVAVAVVCLAVLSLAGAGPAAAQGRSQDGPIVLDGAGGDWDAGWMVADDGLDVFITDSQLHPHQAPTFARSGYDAVALWAHYQPSDDTWYFRIDVDGHAGDSDSQVGTADSPGSGTHGPDQGPLVAPPFMDGVGLGNSEAYKLGFQCAEDAAGQTAEISNSEAIVPGTVSATTMGLDGLAVYGTTVPGVVEFAFPRSTLFPDGVACPQFWLSAQVGDNNDRVSDDQIAATLVVALDLAVLCPELPSMPGQQATLTLFYEVPEAARAEATGVMLVTNVPPGTQFLSASDGGTLSGDQIRWELPNLAPGDSGEVTFTVLLGNDLTSIPLESELTSAEGLRFLSSDVCPVQQPLQTPTATPTPTSTPTPPAPPETPVVPESSTVVLMLTGLGTLAGYASLQWRARRRQ